MTKLCGKLKTSISKTYFVFQYNRQQKLPPTRNAVEHQSHKRVPCTNIKEETSRTVANLQPHNQFFTKLNASRREDNHSKHKSHSS